MPVPAQRGPGRAGGKTGQPHDRRHAATRRISPSDAGFVRGTAAVAARFSWRRPNPHATAVTLDDPARQSHPQSLGRSQTGWVAEPRRDEPTTPGRRDCRSRTGGSAAEAVGRPPERADRASAAARTHCPGRTAQPSPGRASQTAKSVPAAKGIPATKASSQERLLLMRSRLVGPIKRRWPLFPKGIWPDRDGRGRTAFDGAGLPRRTVLMRNQYQRSKTATPPRMAVWLE